jgi:hypothetical protein
VVEFVIDATYRSLFVGFANPDEGMIAIPTFSPVVEAQVTVDDPLVVATLVRFTGGNQPPPSPALPPKQRVFATDIPQAPPDDWLSPKLPVPCIGEVGSGDVKFVVVDGCVVRGGVESDPNPKREFTVPAPAPVFNPPIPPDEPLPEAVGKPPGVAPAFESNPTLAPPVVAELKNAILPRLAPVEFLINAPKSAVDAAIP